MRRLEESLIENLQAFTAFARNNLTVRLHRASKHLRDELRKYRRACAKHGCLDCTCGK